MLELVTEHPEIVIGLVSSFIGYFVAIVVAYAKFAQDLAYIRGQLQGLENLHSDLKTMEERLGTTEASSKDHRARIRMLENHVFAREAKQ